MHSNASVTTYVVNDRLPWPDEDDRAIGKPAFDAALILGPNGAQDCAIAKISPIGVTIQSDSSSRPGDQVMIELPSGQRCAASVEWSQGRSAGLVFAEPLDIIAIINRNLVAQPAERRTMPRIELRCPAHLKWGEHFEAALTRNISASGIQVEGDHLPPVGTYCALFLNGLNLPAADVAWRRDRLAGLEFFEELSWASIIPWVKSMSRRQ